MPPAAAVLIEDRNAELFQPDTALPSQFQDLWAASPRLPPGPRLALAVLQLAVVDFMKYRGARREQEQRMYRKARVWITSQDESWPLSFLNVCETLSIAPDQLRSRVMAASYFERQTAIREVGKLLDAGRR